MKYHYVHQLIARLLCSILISAWLVGCRGTVAPQPPAAWNNQFRAAQEAVQHVAPDAILSGGIVELLDDPQPQQTVIPLKVTLEFIRPSGETISVSYEDTRVQETLTVAPERGWFTPAPTADQRALLIQGANSIRISPAEVVTRTLSEGRAFTAGYGERLPPLIGLHTDVEEVFGTPVAWSVQYFTSDQRELRIWVSAQTGEILGRTNGALYPTPPSGMPTIPMPATP